MSKRTVFGAATSLMCADLGGTLNGSCTLAWWRPTITYLFGMKISELKTLMLKSKLKDIDTLLRLVMPYYNCAIRSNCVVDCRYLKLVKKHGLEISQPGLEPNRGLTWQMNKRRDQCEVHKYEAI